MAIYDPRSLKAEEFINHEEILETLRYAEENKRNVELIDRLLEKARPVRDGKTVHCAGLTHREASVLLACDIPEKVEEMYRLAEEIKLAFYGNRIVMFAPLYLSNYCVNGCVYCPYHLKNKHIARKKLTQDEVRAEVIALQDMGHKRLAIEAGEDPVNNPIEYILECIKTIYSIRHKNGAIRRVNVNIAATTVENYRRLKEAGIGTYILFQETYHKESYLALKDELKRLGVTPDTTYLYIQGHHLFDRVVMPLMKNVCARLVREREREISLQSVHNTQYRNELSCYSSSISDITNTLKKSVGFFASEPYNRIVEDLTKAFEK